MSFDEGRTVHDGWASWRARITPCPSPVRRRLGFRFVKERNFMSWRQRGQSRWFADVDECEDAANRWLDSIVADGKLVR